MRPLAIHFCHPAGLNTPPSLPWDNLGAAGPIELETARTGLRRPPAEVLFKVANRLGFRESGSGQSLAIVLTEMGIDEES